MIDKGTPLFYITSNGKIRPVIANKDERNGCVDVREGNVDLGEIGTLHLCRTLRAAEIMAAARRPK